jgi:predicted Zn-dependent protease
MVRIRLVLVLLLIAAGFSSGCVTVSQNPVSGRSRAYAYSWQQERQLGQEADQQIMAEYGLYEDAELSAYVTRIGEEVLRQSHLRRPDAPQEFRETPFTFRVLDSPIVNAFALPGGYVYVTRGLLAHMENEAQLAMVLGHEVGHVAARHGSKEAAKGVFGQLAVIGAAIGTQILTGDAELAQSVLDLSGTAAQYLFLRYSRDDEREADRLGVEYAALAGFQAGEGADFFVTLQRISQQSGANIPGFMSTHPDPGEREVTIRNLASEWSSKASMTRLNQEQLYNEINGVVLGDNPRQGFEENGTFYHPDLRWQFPVPAGFQVINQASQVALVEQQQKAVLLLTLEGQQVRTATQAGQQFAAQQGVTVVEQGSLRVNGLAAYAVTVDLQNEQGQTFRGKATFIEYDGTVYRFFGYSAKDTYSTYAGAFNRSMQGFARLTDTRILGVQPTRINITQVSRGATFSSFLPNTLPGKLTREDFAILNQVQLNQSISAGQRLKLFR